MTQPTDHARSTYVRILETQFARAGAVLTLDLIVANLRRFEEAQAELRERVREAEAEVMDSWLDLDP